MTNNFANKIVENFSNNFANEMHDRLGRTRAVISWIENNAPRIAQGWRLVTSFVSLWHTVAEMRFRLA